MNGVWIPLSQGRKTLVDEGDAEWARQWKWSAHDGGRNGVRKWYALRSEKVGERGAKRKTISLHRALMGLKPGDHQVVDHLNGDSLDNRRKNLKVVTQHENMAREPGWRKKSTPPEPFL